MVIESLRDICKVIKTTPDEDEMDGSFNGHFTVFLSGDRDKIEELMDRISEIEKFNITYNEKAESSNSVLAECQTNTLEKNSRKLPDQELQLDKVRVLKENLEELPDEEFKPQKIRKTGKLEIDSNSSVFRIMQIPKIVF